MRPDPINPCESTLTGNISIKEQHKGSKPNQF